MPSYICGGVPAVEYTTVDIRFAGSNPCDDLSMHTAAQARFLDLNQLQAEGRFISLSKLC